MKRFGLKTLFVAMAACCLIASQMRISKPVHTSTGPVNQNFDSRHVYLGRSVELLCIYTNYELIRDPWEKEHGGKRPSFAGSEYSWVRIMPSTVIQLGHDFPILGYKSWLKRFSISEGRTPPHWCDQWGSEYAYK